MVSRSKRKFADYVQYYKPNIPITIIEAKDNNHSVGDGMQQALEYAATNGDGFAFHDQTGISPEMESKLELDGLPSPKLCGTFIESGRTCFPQWRRWFFRITLITEATVIPGITSATQSMLQRWQL